MGNQSIKFFPFYREGIGTKINQKDTLTDNGVAERATFEVDVHVTAQPINKGQVNTTTKVSKNIALFGAGDIIGIDQRAVIKVSPRAGNTDFEPNYMPYIEFYEEDFPWRYTPASPNNNDQLRPWLVLVVLEEEAEFTNVPLTETANKPLLAIDILAPFEAVFPKVGETWAWAHVQSNNADVNSATELRTQLQQHPNSALSRIVCPRKLKPKTTYHAFLLPAFEQGRMAGLGEEYNTAASPSIDALRSSWSGTEKRFPYYYRWQFSTGLKGDFEYLVRLIEPRVLPLEVGQRPMDIQEATDVYAIPYQSGIASRSIINEAGESVQIDDGTVFLEGALRNVNAADRTDFISPNATDSNPNQIPQARREYLRAIEELLNLNTAEEDDDPWLIPPLYGKHHAGKTAVNLDETDHWMTELNLDPRYRATAALGTAVVKKKQEKFMSRAWQQVEQVINENKKRASDFLAALTAETILAKHIAPLSDGALLAVAAPLRTKIPTNGGTLAKDLNDSSTPNSAFDPMALRWMNPKHPIRKRIQSNSDEQSPLDEVLEADYQQQILDADRLYREEELSFSKGELVELIKTWPLLNPDDIIESGQEKNSPEGFDLYCNDNEEFVECLQKYIDTYPKRPKSNFVFERATILNRIAPSNVMARKLSVRHPNARVSAAEVYYEYVEVMAYPEFPDATYKNLVNRAADYLLPNLNKIPPNTFALFETNRAFIDAYMVGINHEMGAELLWRAYPTDQKGSYFRQFWDVYHPDAYEDEWTIKEAYKDIVPIHCWARQQITDTGADTISITENTVLGDSEHIPNSTAASDDTGRMVLAIRGELLKRYPNAIIYLVEAQFDNNDILAPRTVKFNGLRKFPIFQAKVEPDITFLGFDISEEEVKGKRQKEDGTALDDPTEARAGYFFVIAEENPGEPRFGLDISSEPVDLSTLTNWHDLTWQHLSVSDGNTISLPDDKKVQNLRFDKKSNADQIAHILFQVPIRVAIHADEMIQQPKQL